ncbi:MAG TPA: FISUMP domain-containing protein [Cyclobacteriaceae bacterium]|nr:FISUMP domain-containing protein [Cyclobacteriaceae bacterium]
MNENPLNDKSSVDSLSAITCFDIFHVHQTTVKSRVIINSSTDYEVLEIGVCWSESKNPTIFDNSIYEGRGTGAFISMITGLSANTTYYARAYIAGQWGTAYGAERNFTTTCKPVSEECEGTFTDSRDEMEYRWVRIGNQVWMAENMAYLPGVSPPVESSFDNPRYYVFDYYGTDTAEAKESDYYALYGVYYNWKAAMQGASGSDAEPSRVKGCCPEGWHIPSVAEWLTLKTFVANEGHFNDEGTPLKSKYGWVESENGNGTDDYGFSGLPSGGRSEEQDGIFGSTGINGHWWTSTDDSSPNAWMLDLSLGMSAHLNIRDFYSNKAFGFAVRCVKD